jgi:pimeloyl-ACP methyl ester carboxylesterase
VAERRRAPLVALGAGVLAAAGAAAIKAVATADRRRSGIARRADRAVVEHPGEPAGMRHHTVTTSDGARLHVTDTGPLDAPVVVLLHGVMITWEVWHPTIRALMADHRVIAPDWRGHGASVAGSDGYGLELLARDLSTILDTLDVRGAIVVGHSMGGMALMHLCRRPPDEVAARVRALVFLSTAPGAVALGPGAAFFDQLARFLTGHDRLAGAARLPPGDLGWVTVRVAFGVRPPAAGIALVRRLILELKPTPVARSVASIIDHDATGWLGQVRLPTAVVVGTHDRLTPLSASQQIAALVPGAELQVLDGAGHHVMFERPTELEAVIRSLEARAAGSAAAPGGAP